MIRTVIDWASHSNALMRGGNTNIGPGVLGIGNVVAIPGIGVNCGAVEVITVRFGGEGIKVTFGVVGTAVKLFGASMVSGTSVNADEQFVLGSNPPSQEQLHPIRRFPDTLPFPWQVELGHGKGVLQLVRLSNAPKQRQLHPSTIFPVMFPFPLHMDWGQGSLDEQLVNPS